LNREWWSSHSNLMKESVTIDASAVTSGPPLDLEQYDLCLQHFVSFLHQSCHLTRRRSLDLARYFIQLEYFNEFKLKEVIEKFSINWLYDILAKESQDLPNQFIFHEIEMISKGLQLPTEENFEVKGDYCQMEKGDDDEWDEKLSKIAAETDLQTPTNELLTSIQQQLSHLQGNLIKLDHSAPSNESKSADFQTGDSDNLLSAYERTLHHLMPMIEIPLSPTTLTSPSSLSSPMIQSPSDMSPPSPSSSDNLQAIYAMDQKLTTIISGLYCLYNQIDHMGIHVNQIQSELIKHENMLTSLLTEEYRVPKYAIIIPIEKISLRSFVSVSSIPHPPPPLLPHPHVFLEPISFIFYLSNHFAKSSIWRRPAGI
jgi:hypothetical protein